MKLHTKAKSYVTPPSRWLSRRHLAGTFCLIIRWDYGELMARCHRDSRQDGGITFFKSLAFLCAVIILSISGFAKTPAEYRKNVESANSLITDLYYTEVEDFSSQADYRNFERETIKEIRKDLPGAENIEWQGATVETGNQWLIDKLEAYEKEPIDSSKRAMLLTEINERLDALEQKLAELENPAISNRTKDEEKQKLSEILKREEYAKPEKQDETWIQSLIRKIKEWLNEKMPQTEERETSQVGYPSFSVLLMIALFIAVFALIGFLIYKFAPFIAFNIRNRTKKEKQDRVILGERLAADEDAGSLFSEAERLAREGNLRQAIRKGYIALLCELSDRKIIGLAQHKTNRDYLRDVRKRHELYQNMNGLTDNFERHWYGFEKMAEKDWEEFRSGYKKAVGSSSKQ